MTITSLAKITTFANFPKHFMLENLAVRADGSVLVVAAPQRQVWCVPAHHGEAPAEPIVLHTFDEGHLAISLVEAEPDTISWFALQIIFKIERRSMHTSGHCPSRELPIRPINTKMFRFCSMSK